MSGTLSIASAKARIRIENQRENFAKLAKAIEGAGFHRSAVEFRKAAEKAIARAEEFEEERLAFDANRLELQQIRVALDTVLGEGIRGGRRLTDAERVAWIVEQWQAASRANPVTQPTTGALP